MKKIFSVFLINLIALNLFISGCSDSGANDGVSETSAKDNIQRIEVTTSIDKTVIATIRTNPSKILYFFALFKSEIEGKVAEPFSRLTDGELFAIYCSIIAYSMAPYGESNAIELYEILNESRLNCGNYVILTRYLFQEGIAAYSMENTQFAFVGWNGGIVGNHAQIFLTKADITMLVDPTIGIAAIADFNSIASGKAVSPSYILDLSTRDELEEFRSTVISAISEGLYVPSDLLYYYIDVEKFKNPATGPEDWPTPGAVSLVNGL